jgi:hypothetical protein
VVDLAQRAQREHHEEGVAGNDPTSPPLAARVFAEPHRGDYCSDDKQEAEEVAAADRGNREVVG